MVTSTILWGGGDSRHPVAVDDTHVYQGSAGNKETLENTVTICHYAAV